MQLHQLKPVHKPKKKRIVGRGGKKGQYSGRGIKGQKARESLNLKPLIRDLIKRYPKLRGYRVKSKRKGVKPLLILSLEKLEKNFSSGDKISPEVLSEKKIIRRIKKEMPIIKILGGGKLTKALNIEGCKVSQTAKEAIEKAGGKIM